MPTPETYGGNANVSSGYVIDAAKPGLELPIMEYLRDEVAPRVLSLGALGSVGAPAASVQFPPADSTSSAESLGSWQCGFRDSAGVMGLTTGVNAACLLQYGTNNVQQSAVFDWQCGQFNIPPCSWVRVAVLPWGAWPSVAVLQLSAFKAVVAPGFIQGARPPTCSGGVTFDAAGPGLNRSFAIPRKAAAFDINHWSGTEGQILVQSSSANGSGAGMRAYRNIALGDYRPPWSPLQLTPGFTGLSFTAATTCVAILRFFLQL